MTSVEKFDPISDTCFENCLNVWNFKMFVFQNLSFWKTGLFHNLTRCIILASNCDYFRKYLNKKLTRCKGFHSDSCFLKKHHKRKVCQFFAEQIELKRGF